MEDWISMDAEKAFEWMELLILHAGKNWFWGKIYNSWIKLLYSSSQASVRTNIQSEYFRLYRCTKVLSFKSPSVGNCRWKLLYSTLSYPSYHRYTQNCVELNISLHAADLLLYISNLSVSVLAVLVTLQTFDHISGYKINLNKSEIFPNLPTKTFPLHNIPFKIARHSFMYLDIQATHKFVDLYDASFVPKLRKSSVAWVNSAKRNIVPWFLCWFWCNPILLSLSSIK